MAEQGTNGKARWIAIALPVFAAVVAVLGFIYGIGQRGGKIAEVVDWKVDTAPRIERMESQGTTSFKLFHEEYLRRQIRQEEQMDKLQQEIHDKQIEDIKQRLLTLERK
jgi:flagellar basal body-associated protein FliL